MTNSTLRHNSFGFTTTGHFSCAVFKSSPLALLNALSWHSWRLVLTHHWLFLSHTISEVDGVNQRDKDSGPLSPSCLNHFPAQGHCWGRALMFPKLQGSVECAIMDSFEYDSWLFRKYNALRQNHTDGLAEISWSQVPKELTDLLNSPFGKNLAHWFKLDKRNKTCSERICVI